MLRALPSDTRPILFLQPLQEAALEHFSPYLKRFVGHQGAGSESQCLYGRGEGEYVINNS